MISISDVLNADVHAVLGGISGIVVSYLYFKLYNKVMYND